MRHFKSSAFVAMLSAAAMFTGSAVKADIIPVFHAATPSGGGTTFEYSVEIAGTTTVKDGDYFTIYDFVGFTGVVVAPAGWTPSTAGTGVTPPGQLLTDNPLIPNVTFTYSGADIDGPVFPVDAFGAFQIESLYSVQNPGGKYASQAHKNNPGQPDDGTDQQNQGVVVVPNAVPEASSLMLLATGLVPLGIMLRRRIAK
jgi:hypothetical protein